MVIINYPFVKGYREVSKILYNTIATYTLDIEAVSCDEMYVDVRQILTKSGIGVENWATHIREEIFNATGCSCSTGFGANRLQARLATRKAKPSGQFYLAEHYLEQFMAEISVTDLPGVGRSTAAKLNEIGVKTCGDVLVSFSLPILLTFTTKCSVFPDNSTISTPKYDWTEVGLNNF